MEGKEGKKSNKKKLRITLIRNVRRTDSRVVLLLQDGSLLHQARQAASDKLRIPHSQVSKPLIEAFHAPKRFFNSYSDESIKFSPH
jgi:hypothetical protein